VTVESLSSCIFLLNQHFNIDMGRSLWEIRSSFGISHTQRIACSLVLPSRQGSVSWENWLVRTFSMGFVMKVNADCFPLIPSRDRLITSA
jgi:hypothetical protein